MGVLDNMNINKKSFCYSRKYILYTVLIAIVFILSGCKSEESLSQEDKIEEQADLSDAADETETDTAKKILSEDEPIESYPIEAGLYNRTYLTKSDGEYVYSLTDEEIIKEYDNLYAPAFQEVVDSYEEIMSYQNQSYDFGKPATVINLALTKPADSEFINVGSYFEMDYGFDLNKVGYTYIDLDSDGSFELILGVIAEERDEWMSRDCFERAYTLIDDKPVRFVEGGSRVLFWLGNDGYVYETGSGGAANNGIWKMHFDSSTLDKNWIGWGSTGFLNEEFLGVWDTNIYISHPFEDIDAEAKLAENQIKEDDSKIIYDEWNSRYVAIEWFKLSDYLAENNIYEL